MPVAHLMQIGDMGLSSVSRDGFVSARMVGTINFMAPEALRYGMC